LDPPAIPVGSLESKYLPLQRRAPTPILWSTFIRQSISLDLRHPEDASIGEMEIAWALERVPREARETLLRMPAREPGTGKRIDRLMYEFDMGIRGQSG